MDKQIRRIGVLTSGGDAPGMNALIRSVVRSASANDISVLGIRRGYSGLINGDIIEMGARSVDGIIRKGGTMLYTARSEEFMTPEGREIGIVTQQAVFSLIGQIQEETHRFAIEFHRSLRSKEQVHSLLDDIPGIGETRRKALMRKFKSIENIRDASLEELAETESMNAGSAQKVYEIFSWS